MSCQPVSFPHINLHIYKWFVVAIQVWVVTRQQLEWHEFFFFFSWFQVSFDVMEGGLQKLSHELRKKVIKVTAVLVGGLGVVTCRSEMTAPSFHPDGN
jgi:hypothetical protein